MFIKFWRIEIVKKISVPKKVKLKKVSRIGTGITGFDKFDKLIGNGFESESINLVVGGSGSGKSIFSLQFLLEGVRKGGAYSLCDF